MPRYDYKCQNCGITFEAITSSDTQWIPCIECKDHDVTSPSYKQLSAPASIHIH